MSLPCEWILPSTGTIAVILTFAANDAVASVAAIRGAEIENIITISKIRGMMPKARIVRLAQRESGLATETIRRVQ